MKDYLKYASLGFEIITTMLITGLGGYFLDKWLETKPWFLLAFLLLGCVIVLVRISKIK